MLPLYKKVKKQSSLTIVDIKGTTPTIHQENPMFALDQTLAVGYRVAELRSEAQRDALARRVAKHRRSGLLRRSNR
jgi:hypothetical protein